MTYLYQKVNFWDFKEAFRQAGRRTQFSDNGLKLLFDYLTEVAEDTGEPIEVDVVALCCDYDVLTVSELQEQFGPDWESEANSVAEWSNLRLIAN